MGDFLNQLKEVWPLVMSAPWVFAAIAAFLFLTGWGVGRFAFGERIANLKSRIENRDERIEALEARLLGLQSAQPVASPVSVPGPEALPRPQSRKGIVGRTSGPKTLRDILIEGDWILHFNPGAGGGRKSISFLPNGAIGEGNNSNEHTWAIEGASGEYLTIYRANGSVQNVFYFSDQSGRLEYMPDSRSQGIKNQFIAPR